MVVGDVVRFSQEDREPEEQAWHFFVRATVALPHQRRSSPPRIAYQHVVLLFMLRTRKENCH